MYFIDRSVAVLKPTQAFLDWLTSLDENMPDITLAQLTSNCTTLLVPQSNSPEEIIGYIGEKYHQIFAAELSSWEIPQQQWPKDMSLAHFWSLFTVEIHDTVLDLEDDDLQLSPVSD